VGSVKRFFSARAPFGQISHVVVSRSIRVNLDLISREIIFEVFQPM